MLDDETAAIVNVGHDALRRHTFTQLLQQAGFQVHEAARGDEALRLMDSKPALVLIHVNVRDINGPDLCRRIKADPVTAAIPVLYVSATAKAVADRIQALQSGAEGCLVEPVDPAELVGSIRALVRLRRIADRLACLQSVTAALLGAYTSAQVVAVILAQGLTAMGAQAGCVRLMSADGQNPDPVGTTGLPHAILMRPPSVTAAASTPLGDAVRTGQPIWLHNIQDLKARYPELAQAHATSGFEAAAVLPLVLDGQPLGTLALAFAQAREFGADDREFLTMLAQQCAQALERAQLFEAERSLRSELGRSVHQLQALQSVMEVGLRHLDLDGLLHDLLDHIRSALVADTTAILLLSPDGHALVARAAQGLEAGASDLHIPLGRGVAGRIAAENRPLIIQDLAQVEVYRPILRAKGVCSLVGVPLRSAGQVIGVVHVGTLVSRSFTEADAQLLQLAADHIGLAIEHARLYEAAHHARHRTEQAAERVVRLQAVTAALSETLTRDEVAAVVIQQAIPALGAITGTAAVLTPDATAFEIIAHVGLAEERVKPWLLFPADAAVPMADAARQGELILLPTRESLKTRYPNLASITPRHQAGAVIPFLIGGRAVGALTLSFGEDRDFNLEDKEFMLALGRQCAQALERARLYAAEQQARRAAERSAKRTAQLQVMTAALSQALTPEVVSDVVLHQGVLAIGASAGVIVRLSQDGASLERVQQVGYPEAHTQAFRRIPITMEIPVADCVRAGEPLWIRTRQAYAARYPQLAELRNTFGNEATAVVPLLIENRVFGAIGFSFAEAREFGPNEQGFLLALAGLCAQAWERARLYEAERAARAEAESLNAELEQRVLRRTFDLEQSQEHLRSLAGRLEQAREEERKRLAQEMHDQLGGALTSFKMDLAQLRKQFLATSEASVADRIDGMSHLLDDTLQDVRRMASSLRPRMLDDFGLWSTIEWYSDEFEAHSGIACVLELGSDEPSLDPDSALAIFRVLQESLTNVARHAQARLVEIRIEGRDGFLVLQVSDDGRGITTQEISGAKSLGLFGMHERVLMLAGDLDIRGRPGEGTTVLVKIPLARPMPGV